MNLITSHSVSLKVNLPPPDYMGMLKVLLNSMSMSSRRQYEHTFNDWRSWCADNGLSPDELSAPNVMSYLQSRSLSRATKQARLTHLRRLVQTLHSADTSNILLETDLPPTTRPMRVRVELVLQTQQEGDSLNCCADDDDCTPDATVQ